MLGELSGRYHLVFLSSALPPSTPTGSVKQPTDPLYLPLLYPVWDVRYCINVRYLDALCDPLFPRPAMIPLSPVLHYRSSVLHNSLDVRPASLHAFVPALGYLPRYLPLYLPLSSSWCQSCRNLLSLFCKYLR